MRAPWIHCAPHQVVRYAFVLRSLRRLPASARLLEVGSGPRGIGSWSGRPLVGVDLAFDRRPKDPLVPVAADAVALPFRDGAFDLVFCVDVLPDVPRDLLRPVCAEMARVARPGATVVVVSPCGPDAEESDRRMLRWLRGHGIRPEPWLPRQVEQGLASVEDVAAALAPWGRVTTEPNTSVRWHERLLRLEARIRRYHGMTALQPAVIAWGRLAPRELPGRTPTYRWRFVLETGATSSPP